MRPLALDVVTFLLPLAAGAFLFLFGRRFRHWSRPLRALAILGSFAVIGVAVFSAYSSLPPPVEWTMFYLGGMTTILCLMALFLFGVVWSVPGRSMSSNFIASLACIAFALIAIEASGKLWWRFVAPEAWERTANPSGLLQQSSGMTCSPTAAVMLLSGYGVPASEGEMAYLAGTTLLGTDAHGITRALEEKVKPRGWHVTSGHTTYDECLQRGGPFLAHMKGQTLGHAVVVNRMGPEGVEILDPADGQAGTMPRHDFEQEWNGIAVRIVE